MAEPIIIQGGMGVGVSNWLLAHAVSEAGHLGVVSGTGLDAVLARRLQDGDPGGDQRRALAHFPVPEIAQSIIDKYYIPGGRQTDEPYRPIPMYAVVPRVDLQQLTVAANFVEVFLAKDGHDGVVGINYLTKIELPTIPSLYGAMLAGVDYVCMGAGIPREVPGILDRLAQHEKASLRLTVEGATPDDDFRMHFDPAQVVGGELPPLKRPKFLAIVSSSALATSMARKSTGKVDGFVVEKHSAGGHNAPPRGELQLDDAGEPIYGLKDEPDLEKMRTLGAPFWLAGSFDAPGGLQAALDEGASGIQVGTAFAFCDQSGLSPEAKVEILEAALRGDTQVFTDPRVSPTGFPFKVVRKTGSLSEPDVYEARRRSCDLGYLRQLYKKPDGSIGYRCPAGPILDYVRRGGRLEETVGRKCLCNALLANIGLGQIREPGNVERLLVTAGDCLRVFKRFGDNPRRSYSALDVIEYLLKPFGKGIRT